jgi:hypothetical protein
VDEHVCFNPNIKQADGSLDGLACFNPNESRRVNECGHVCFKDSRRVNECGHVCFKDSRRVNEHVDMCVSKTAGG